MNTAYEVWGLWDAEELVSVHLTSTDARDARERHLAGYRDFRVEQDIIAAAVKIRRTRLVDQPSPLAVPAHRRQRPTSEGAP